MNLAVAKRHARLGPSSSEIWLQCLGAPAAWLTAGPRLVGFAAHEGTLAHTLCEAALTLNNVPWKEGQSFNVEGDDVEITQEMLNCVQIYATVASNLSDVSQWRIIESEVSLDWLWAPGQAPEQVFGTLDFGACDGQTIYIVDFKYGRGKAVLVDANTQLLCYAVALLGRIRIERPDLYATLENVCLVIVQPRAGGDAVRAWNVSLGDLLFWAFGTLKPSIDKISGGFDVPLTAGNHCYWCPASKTCLAYRRLKMQRSVESFPDDVEDEEGKE